MQLRHVDTILLVEDIQRSKKFYCETLGLEPLHDWGSMVVFKERFAILQASELLPHEQTSAFLRPGLQGRGNVVVYFECERLETCLEEMKAAGVDVVHEILALPWQRIFRVYDPDRYILEIGEPFESP